MGLNKSKLSQTLIGKQHEGKRMIIQTAYAILILILGVIFLIAAIIDLIENKSLKLDEEKPLSPSSQLVIFFIIGWLLYSPWMFI